jgi:nicotinamidase/pyrazinamidase
MQALILVDLQYDFMPGGALAVPAGDQVVPLANELAALFDLVVASQDWHPPDHGSFASQYPGKKPGDVIELAGLRQELWPDHCVQNTPGAELHRDLERSRIARIFHKGTEREIDSYSTFFDNAHRRSTGLGEYLNDKGVREVFLMGLATDYCVRFSALDAIGLGFKTNVVGDGCSGINLSAGDVDRAISEMAQRGVSILRSDELRAHSPTRGSR